MSKRTKPSLKPVLKRSLLSCAIAVAAAGYGPGGLCR